MDKLIELVLTAVATVAATAIVIAIVKRLICVRLFRNRCDLAFTRAIMHDSDIKEENKSFWLKFYNNKKPSDFKLFFSNRPLEIPAWFTTEEIDFFFIPAYKFNNPVKEAKANHSILNYRKHA